MKQGTSLAILVIIVMAIGGSIAYLCGKNAVENSEYEMNQKTVKVFRHIRENYPTQWEEIEASRPYIEYDIAINEY